MSPEHMARKRVSLTFPDRNQHGCDAESTEGYAVAQPFDLSIEVTSS